MLKREDPVTPCEVSTDLRALLDVVFSHDLVDDCLARIEVLIAARRCKQPFVPRGWVDQTDVILITYGDTIADGVRPTLEVLRDFLSTYVSGYINNIHILPCFPWSSDDGFSIIDYRDICPEFGQWTHIVQISEDFGVMLDAVINHVSSESVWFRGFQEDDPRYRDFFHVCDPTEDYSSVTRPRALPLLRCVETIAGQRHVWTTFSDDQIDLNYANPDVLLEILDVLLHYADKGARFIRLDAIGFLWKKLGTTCMHLPETHAIVKVIRYVFDRAFPDVILITETNVPHAENVSYFGDGKNESHMVYQFPLPPLTLHAFYARDARRLSKWASSLEPTSASTTYFNFLSSHDGIGLRPAEGLLTREELSSVAAHVEANGGRVSMRTLPDGETSPYELNISFLDAISEPEDGDACKVEKFLAAQTILLSLVGVPGIYIHSLLGSRNDYRGLEQTGRNRSINREKLNFKSLVDTLARSDSLRAITFEGHKKLLAARRERPAFHPNSRQRVVYVDPRVFSLVREGRGDRVWVLVNVSPDQLTVQVRCADLGLRSDIRLWDVLSDHTADVSRGHIQVALSGYAKAWFIEEV